jgi:hypothetical protein
MSIEQHSTKIKSLANETVSRIGLLPILSRWLRPADQSTIQMQEVSEPNSIFLVILIILVAFGSFGLGRLSIPDQARVEPIVFEPTSMTSSGQSATILSASIKRGMKSSLTTHVSGAIVASKTGTKYHFPWCSGAARIKDENKVWFASEADARTAGYTPASNCKGLK